MIREFTGKLVAMHEVLDVVTAEDGEDALRKLDAKDETSACPFVLVLTDVLMPFMDGVELARCIRDKEADECDRGRRLRIIGVSANGDDHACRRDCFAAGMDDVLSKPLRIDTIKQLLAGLSIPLHSTPLGL